MVEQDASTSTIDPDRRGLITKILQHQDLDSLLRLSVVLCNHELQGDGCSLFLYEAERSEIVLRESTVLTRFLGQHQSVDVMKTWDAVERIRGLLEQRGLHTEGLDRVLTSQRTEPWGPELHDLLHNFGLTRWAYWFKSPLLIDDVQSDVRWSSPHLAHCEVADPGSIIIAPIGDHSLSLPRAVLRVVRKKGRQGFGETDLDWLNGFADLLAARMETAISLSDLTDLGTQLEVEDFGRRLVNLLRQVLRAKGCSIFLETDPPSEEDNSEHVFQCIATTGLVSEGRRVDKEASYTITNGQTTTEHLTSWVLLRGELIALTDVHHFDPTAFPGLANRKPGSGKFSEMDPHGEKFEVGPILISPLFLYQRREVAGAIRVSRPRGDEFETHEQLLFLDISRRLSRVLTNLHLRQASEKLIKLYNSPDEMLNRIPKDVCHLLGVEGCSVLLRHGNVLVLAATAGALKGQEGSIRYDVSDPHSRGWTGWVAHKRRALLLNFPEEAKRYDEEDPPCHVWGEVKRPCETGEHAYRFLAVPIFRNPEDPLSDILGVVRVPRKQTDPPFEEVHKSILSSFAARLSLALNLARRNEQLEAIVELPHVANAPEDPKKVAGRIVQRAVDVLIEKFGFDSGAIFMLDIRTGKIERRGGRRNGGELASEVEADSLHARVIRQHEAESEGEGQEKAECVRFVCPILLGVTALGTIEVSVPPSRPISAREKNMVQLLAGICANALYNEAVFRKLDDLRRSLVTVGEQMTVERPLIEKLEVIAEAAADVTQADNVIIHEYVGPPPEDDSSRGRFRNSACGGRRPKVWREVDQSRDAVPFRIVERKEPIFANSAKESLVLFHQKGDLNFIQREEIHSVAALPLRVRGTSVGCIFFNFVRQQDFDPPQRQQEIRMMAEYAAVAIYQARLLEEKTKLAREKSNLLRYAEHSLNQPLNALLGYLSNLSEGVYHPDLKPSDRERFLKSDFAKRAEQYYQLCEYLCYIVDTFLRIDQLGTRGLFEIKRASERNLSDVCRRAVGIAEAYLQGKIAENIPWDDVIGEFDDNATQISLLNVLFNAVKHGRPVSGRNDPGDIRLTLSQHTRVGVPWAEIRVEDSGPGVPPEKRELIFEKNDYSEDEKPTGLGIGLFLTRGYIREHGGTVSVEDTRLGGACFVIQLPLSSTPENAA